MKCIHSFYKNCLYTPPLNKRFLKIFPKNGLLFEYHKHFIGRNYFSFNYPTPVTFFSFVHWTKRVP